MAATTAGNAPSAESLRWTLAIWGTATYPLAALVIALTVAHGHQLLRAYAYVLAAPEPVSVFMGYGVGYLIVQFRVRNPNPSFLQSQVFGACAFAGMVAAVSVLHLLLPGGSPAALSFGVVIALKACAGAVAAALIYPWLSHKRSPSERYRTPASRRATGDTPADAPDPHHVRISNGRSIEP